MWIPTIMIVSMISLIWSLKGVRSMKANNFGHSYLINHQATRFIDHFKDQKTCPGLETNPILSVEIWTHYLPIVSPLLRAATFAAQYDPQKRSHIRNCHKRSMMMSNRKITSKRRIFYFIKAHLWKKIKAWHLHDYATGWNLGLWTDHSNWPVKNYSIPNEQK